MNAAAPVTRADPVPLAREMLPSAGDAVPQNRVRRGGGALRDLL